MNRASFLKIFGFGIAGAATVAKALSKPETNLRAVRDPENDSPEGQAYKIKEYPKTPDECFTTENSLAKALLTKPKVHRQLAKMFSKRHTPSLMKAMTEDIRIDGLRIIKTR